MRRALYILGYLNDEDLVWLGERGERRALAAGTTLIRQGEAVDALYIVTDGRLEVRVGDGTAIAVIGPGDILGEMSLIEKRPPGVTVTAVSDCRLLAIPQAMLRNELEKNQGFAARFYQAIAVFLSDRLRSTVARLGYGGVPPDAEDAIVRENSLDEALLDRVHLAGERMVRLLAMLEGRRP